MIDLRWTDLSFGLSLFFNLAFLLFVFVYYKECVSLPAFGEKKRISLLLYSLVLVIVVSAGSNSDWYSYQQMVWDFDPTAGATNYGESFYSYLIAFVNQNYLLFRLFVWGGAFILSLFVFARFGVDVNVAVFFLISVFLIRFNYARASLAMSSYFFGLSFLLKPIKSHRLLSFILMALSFWGAYEFHHSLLPILLLTLVVYLPIDKYYVLLLILVLLPFGASIISNSVMSGSSLTADLFEDDYFTTKIAAYSDREYGQSSLLGIIGNILMYGAFVFPALITTILVARNSKSLELHVKRLYRLMISIVLFSVSFLFMGINSYLFFYRYLFMSMIPLTILCTYLYQNSIMKKNLYICIVLWGIVSTVQPLITGLYHTL